jgi:hypothetical protein
LSAVEEETMHKFTPLIAAAAVCAAGVSLVGRADAGALAGADGLRPALDQMNITETVHCTPGFAHRRTPPRDGCYRRVYRAPAPAYSYGYGYGPYAYGYPYGYYRPGISIGVGGWGHRGWGWGPGVGIGFGW